MIGRVLRSALLVIVLALLAAPSVVILVVSFGEDAFITFPPQAFGVSHYTSIFTNSLWLDAFLRSLEVAALVSAIAVCVGVCYVFGVRRSRLRGSHAFELVVLGPVLVPSVSYAVAMYALYADLHLVGTRFGIVVAHTLLAMPFVVLVLGSALARIPRELEYAAMTLGSGRWGAYKDITLRLLSSAVAASAILAFTASFDEAVFVSFLGGPGFTTLPLEIFNSLKSGVDPAITAIGAVLTVVAAGLLALTALIRRRSWTR